MVDGPRSQHGLIATLVALRVAAERERRAVAAKSGGGDEAPADDKPKKKRGWFG